MKIFILTLLILLSTHSLVSASTGPIGDDRTVSGLGDDEQLVFEIPYVQKGYLKSGLISSSVNFQVKIQIIHYGIVTHSGRSVFKGDLSLASQYDSVAESKVFEISDKFSALTKVPVNGVIKLDSSELNSLLADIPNPDYADIKITLLHKGIMNDTEIQSATIEVRQLKNYILSVMKDGSPIGWRLGSKNNAVESYVKIRAKKI